MVVCVRVSVVLLNMCEGAKRSAWAISGLLHVVAFGALVDVGMKLLLGACVAHAAIVALFALNQSNRHFPVSRGYPTLPGSCQSSPTFFTAGHGVDRYLNFFGFRRRSLGL